MAYTRTAENAAADNAVIRAKRKMMGAGGEGAGLLGIAGTERGLLATQAQKPIMDDRV